MMCAGSSEPSLVANSISTQISASPNLALTRHVTKARPYKSYLEFAEDKNRFCLSTHRWPYMYCASEVERREESEEIVDLHVRRLVRAFLDCKSWLRIFTISLNKMTMRNRKKLLFHYLTRHSLGVSMFCDSEPYRPCK